MKRKLFILMALGTVVLTGIFAEDSATEFELGWQGDASWQENSITPGTIGAHEKDGIYSSSNVKAGVTLFETKLYSLGLGVGDTLELKLNPGTFPGASNQTALGNIEVKNKFTFELDNTVKITDYLNILINMELRMTAALGTASSIPANPEVRIAPILGVEGGIAGFSYSVVEAFNYYTDQDGDSSAKSDYFELDGAYEIGYSFTLSESLSLDLGASDALTIAFNNPDKSSKQPASIANETFVTIGLGFKGISPFVGLWLYNEDDNFETSDNDINGVGLICGIGFSINSWNIDLNYKGAIDVNSAKSNQKWENTASVSVSTSM